MELCPVSEVVGIKALQHPRQTLQELSYLLSPSSFSLLFFCLRQSHYYGIWHGLTLCMCVRAFTCTIFDHNTSSSSISYCPAPPNPGDGNLGPSCMLGKCCELQPQLFSLTEPMLTYTGWPAISGVLWSTILHQSFS